jgi:peptidoglycan/xylan/chitin deacetylase (PgdA/CDA1 family)
MIESTEVHEQEQVPRRAARYAYRRRRRRVPVLAVAALGLVASAALAFFLLPASATNSVALIRVNQTVIALAPGAKVKDVAALSGLIARAGSSLDLTGDVKVIGGGDAAVRVADGRQLSEEQTLDDGTSITVQHGAHSVEGLRVVEEDIPFDTTVKGSGDIVSVAQMGSPGRRETYKGRTSSKVAASIVLAAPKDRQLTRSATRKPGQRLVALTFDDGPGTHTQEVLDALAAAHVPATFFVLGSMAAGNRSLIEKERQAGCEVENHTWNHPDLTKVSAAEFRSQVSRTSAVLGGSKFLRPPYGASNATVKSLAASMGMRLAFWTVDTQDWLRQDVSYILAKVKAQTKPGGIILMHDGGADREKTVAAIPVVVDWLFQQGYSITTVDHIL